MNVQENIVKQFPPEMLKELGIEQGDPLPEPYEELPPDLWPAAMAKLAQVHAQEARVSPHSGGKLSRWAAQKRKERRKTAAASRRRNRR